MLLVGEQRQLPSFFVARVEDGRPLPAALLVFGELTEVGHEVLSIGTYYRLRCNPWLRSWRSTPSPRLASSRLSYQLSVKAGCHVPACAYEHGSRRGRS